MRLNETARGIHVISAAPFTDNGALDLDSVDPLVDFYVQHDCRHRRGERKRVRRVRLL